MAATATVTILPVVPPTTWPEPPEEMTVSTLIDIESCPRRWALTSAEYPALWAGRGYPPRVRLSTLVGSVVHLVIERVARELVHAGCATVYDGKAAEVMKALGGYTTLVQDCLDRVISRHAKNPRVGRFLEHLTHSLRRQVPELRAQAQGLLGRVRLSSITNAGRAERSRSRGALPNGTFTEIELRASQIGWKGKADLLALSEEACEIIDFKTGVEDHAHEFQISVYALLWSRDAELNPTRRHADRLTLAYSAKDITVPTPSAAQLHTLELELIARREAAQEAVRVGPPEARPTLENCRFCDVRQLCDAYWRSGIPVTTSGTPIGTKAVDLEVTILERHGPASWEGVVTGALFGTQHTRIVLRTSEEGIDLRRGDVIRFLDVLATPGESVAVPLVLTMTSASEAFRVR
jgi:hypothetical protein